MIERWNELVKDGDTIYHLGDFGWTRYQEELSDIVRNRLNGHIILIKGNHDLSLRKMANMGIPETYRSFVFENRYMLNHYPAHNHTMTVDDVLNRKVGFLLQDIEDKALRRRMKTMQLLIQHNCDRVIHGHIHNSNENNYPKHFNVGVDVNDFYPFSWEEVKKQLNQEG